MVLCGKIDGYVMKLIKLRCQMADKKSVLEQKKEFVDRADLNPRKWVKKNSKNEIYNLFPPRSQWAGIGSIGRYNLDSVARNERRLKWTYLKAKKRGCIQEWYMSLCQKADDIVKYAMICDIGISSPEVLCIEKGVCKEKKTITCRPICTFSMYDKIVLSLLNNYLTALFDDYFFDCSYAFRKPNGSRSELQHLDAVKKVQDYRKNHLDESLFVAECDMKKFYDTISHQVIKIRFIKLLQRAKREGKIDSLNAKYVKRWFFAYVDCFDYVSNILVQCKKPLTAPVWRNINKIEGYKIEIGWLDKKKDKDFDWRGVYTKKGRVGVPQGGSLSGLIANIVMHDVDDEVLDAIGKKDILYCRFCDDMVLIGANKEEVSFCYQAYEEAIKKARLIAHENKPIKNRPMRDFWEGKTRGPYEWNEKGENIYPWVTFVGYDVNWKGNLRIRKKSLRKQLEKQTTLANELILPYLRGKRPRYSKGTVLESLHARLIATGVGRVTFENFRNNINVHSWMSAFSILDKNPWSEKQMKILDKHRQTVLRRTEMKIANIYFPNNIKKDDTSKNRRDYYAYKGCPFSYYGQCFHYKQMDE